MDVDGSTVPLVIHSKIIHLFELCHHRILIFQESLFLSIKPCTLVVSFNCSLVCVGVKWLIIKMKFIFYTLFLHLNFIELIAESFAKLLDKALLELFGP
jgi:hypothetical protein